MNYRTKSFAQPLAAISLGLMCTFGQAWAYTATPVGGTVTADAMAQSLLSQNSGIVINSASYTGANAASGTFTGGSAIFGIDDGIVITSGSAETFGDNPLGLPGIAILKPLTTGVTQDASVLTIRFTPAGNQVQFSYVFGSAEYPDYVDSEYNDAFGFFVNGTNYALLPNSQPVAINNINCGDDAGVGAQPFCSIFVDNRAGAHGLAATALGGWTQILTLNAPVNPGVENELILAIADVGDGALDSAALIQGGTLQVCGGPGQSPCDPGTGGPGADAVALPLSSPAQLGLMALLLAGLAGWQLRYRRRA